MKAVGAGGPDDRLYAVGDASVRIQRPPVIIERGVGLPVAIAGDIADHVAVRPADGQTVEAGRLGIHAPQIRQANGFGIDIQHKKGNPADAVPGLGPAQGVPLGLALQPPGAAGFLKLGPQGRGPGRIFSSGPAATGCRRPGPVSSRPLRSPPKARTESCSARPRSPGWPRSLWPGRPRKTSRAGWPPATWPAWWLR